MIRAKFVFTKHSHTTGWDALGEPMRRLLLSLLLLGVSLFVACGGSSGSGSGGSNPPPVTLSSISISPASPSIATGATQQFSATGSYSDGSTKDLSATAAWSSASTSVATISTSGLATGVAAGTSNISATFGGIVGTTTLTVSAVLNPLVSIAVTPATASVAANSTQQFAATGTYADGSTQNITSSVAWSASTGATITAGGLATGVTPGTSTIMAASSSISGTATLTITNPLVSIAVTPSPASVAVGYTQAFAATGTYADGTASVITSIVTWASANTSVATISNSAGTQGVANGLAAGSTSITATLGPVTSPPVTLTVTNATVTSIAVSPPNPSIPLGNQQQFTATGTFSDGSTHDITNNVTWTSSDPTKVNIIASGFATGVAVTGTPVTITATDKRSSVQGTTTATVNAGNLVSIAITPSATNLAVGTSRQYIATGTLTNGSTLDITHQTTWTSSDPFNATVNNGLVKALTGNCASKCPVIITATLASISQTVTVSVNNVSATSITVTPITASIPAGVTQLFTATATFSDATTQDISANASWSSDNTAVATVNVIGRALGISAGTANITATFGGQSGTAQLTVSTATLVSLAITPTNTILAPGSTVSYQALGTYSDGSKQYLLSTWSSSDPTVVSVVSPGIATGLQAGSATITATYGTVTSNPAGVIVTTSSLASISVTPSTASVAFGVSTPFAATGTFQDGSTQSLTSTVTWASSQPSIATISNAIGQQGVATGLSAGQTSITAVFAGVVNQVPATLTVTNATIVSIAVTTATPTVTAGTTANFTAKGTFSDGSVIDLSTQVAWSSSNTTVAVMNAYGQAITASAGTTVITATFTQNGVQVSGTANLTVQ